MDSLATLTPLTSLRAALSALRFAPLTRPLRSAPLPRSFRPASFAPLALLQLRPLHSPRSLRALRSAPLTRPLRSAPSFASLRFVCSARSVRSASLRSLRSGPQSSSSDWLVLILGLKGRRSLRPSALSPVDLSFLVRGCRLSTLSFLNQLPRRRSLVEREDTRIRERPTSKASFEAMWLLLVATLCGYSLWLLFVATLCGYSLWLLFVATLCGYSLWLLFVATLCGYSLWLLFVATLCGYSVWLLFVATLCGYSVWLLFVATLCGYFFVATLCGYSVWLLCVATLCGLVAASAGEPGEPAGSPGSPAPVCLLLLSRVPRRLPGEPGEPAGTPGSPAPVVVACFSPPPVNPVSPQVHRVHLRFAWPPRTRRVVVVRVFVASSPLNPVSLQVRNSPRREHVASSLLPRRRRARVFVAPSGCPGTCSVAATGNNWLATSGWEGLQWAQGQRGPYQGPHSPSKPH